MTGVCFMNNVKSLLKQLKLTKQTYTVMVRSDTLNKCFSPFAVKSKTFT